MHLPTLLAKNPLVLGDQNRIVPKPDIGFANTPHILIPATFGIQDTQPLVGMAPVKPVLDVGFIEPDGLPVVARLFVVLPL